MSRVAIGLLLVLGFVLAGCSGKDAENVRPAYLDDPRGQPLAVVPGMQVTDTGVSDIPGLANSPVPEQAADITPPKIVTPGQGGTQANAPAEQSHTTGELKQDSQGTPYLLVPGEYETVWPQLLQALKRAGFQIDDINPDRGYVLLTIKDPKDKEHPKQIRLVAARGYQEVRILIQEAGQPTPLDPRLALPILKIIQTTL